MCYVVSQNYKKSCESVIVQFMILSIGHLDSSLALDWIRLLLIELRVSMKLPDS
jgi:hypothetical protein